MAISRICSVENCSNPHYARSFCIRHYQRWKRNGDPLGGAPTNGYVQDWLERHVNWDGDDCLIWPFAADSRGYGMARGGKASRIMCERAHGDPPTDRHEAAHSCGNGRGGCVNPRHLRWATSLENAADAKLHGTDPSGERNGRSKLTERQVQEALKLSKSHLHREIAATFGVSRSTISRALAGKTWSSIGR